MHEVNQIYDTGFNTMSFKTMRILFISLISFLISFSAQSQWFEASGQAYINNNDTKLARNKAIENALKKTLLVAGASVSSVQQVVNGLLTKDEVNIKVSGIVNSFEIVNENHTDNIIEVVIRADIFPQEKQCYSTDYQKSLLLTQSHILHREQANIGSIYQLDTEVIQGLAGHLKKQSRYINTNLSLKSKTEFSRLNNSGQQNKIKDLSMSLANISDNQFILYSEISDISLLPSENKSWAFWQNQYKNRNFDITVYLYDGINGELVFEKKYQ